MKSTRKLQLLLPSNSLYTLLLRSFDNRQPANVSAQSSEMTIVSGIQRLKSVSKALKSRKLQRLAKLMECRENARERRDEQNKKRRKGDLTIISRYDLLDCLYVTRIRGQNMIPSSF